MTLHLAINASASGNTGIFRMKTGLILVASAIAHLASILMETGSYILMEDGLSTIGLE